MHWGMVNWSNIHAPIVRRQNKSDSALGVDDKSI